MTESHEKFPAWGDTVPFALQEELLTEYLGEKQTSICGPTEQLDLAEVTPGPVHLLLFIRPGEGSAWGGGPGAELREWTRDRAPGTPATSNTG